MKRLCRQFPAESRCGLGIESAEGLTLKIPPSGDIIVAGRFDSLGSKALNNIARWDGSDWQPMGNGFNDDVTTLAVYNNQLYAGGLFGYSGTDTVRNLAKWNGTQWEGAAPYINNYVFTSVVYDNKLIIGGQFSKINGVNFYSIAALDNTTWQSVGYGFNNQVIKLKVVDDTLYSCGNFTAIPNNPCSYISKFNGLTWDQVSYPIGTTSIVRDIVKYNNALYACGSFSNPNDFGRIGVSQFDSIGSCDGLVKHLSVYKNQLYLGGYFTTIGGLTTRCMASYDSSITSDIYSIENEVTEIYPNPINSKSRSLFIESSTRALKLCQIFSFKGELISSFSLSGNSEEITLGELSPSIYLAVLYFANGTFIKRKIIIIM